jgi:hypothetical protein
VTGMFTTILILLFYSLPCILALFLCADMLMSLNIFETVQVQMYVLAKY